MHAVEYDGHAEEVGILEADDIPFVCRCWLVDVDVGQDAEGEDDDPHVDPNGRRDDVDGCD